MNPLDNISDEVIHARGVYATIRSAHEDQKSAIQMKCGNFTSLTSQVLKYSTSNDPSEHCAAVALLKDARKNLDELESMLAEIESLAKQRGEWKSKAWSK